MAERVRRKKQVKDDSLPEAGKHYKRDLSDIKNKILRSELYRKEKQLKEKEKRKQREKRKRERNGEDSKEEPPKQVQKTLDNMRVKDETMVDLDDEEVMQDAATDEFASYFDGNNTPKVLFTTCNRPRNHDTLKFIEDLLEVIPNSEYRNRKGIDIKKIIPQAIERGFTDLVVINEDQKIANGLIISHLPDGPTAHFKLSSVKRIRNIKNHGRITQHRPELILNNFNTRLGHSVGRLLAALFPYDPQFQGRRAATFHNQRDFIFFRHHRYTNNKAGAEQYSESAHVLYFGQREFRRLDGTWNLTYFSSIPNERVQYEWAICGVW